MLIVVHATGEQAPCDPRILVSECDGDHICVTSLPHFQQPETSWVLLSTSSAQRGASAVDEQGAKIAISTLTDAQQPRSATTRSLFRDKPDPCRKLSPILEAFSITRSRLPSQRRSVEGLRKMAQRPGVVESYAKRLCRARQRREDGRHISRDRGQFGRCSWTSPVLWLTLRHPSLSQGRGPYHWPDRQGVCGGLIQVAGQARLTPY